ncbi:hypothetical protein ELG97_37040 [Rhizobium leguminosarum]|uniref:hypothetical protein n=1 Tax=Rhizobium leguminosarum TaxID=384 RepID=UPI00103104C2|nr:hypothetical protein [Rhizobium leguminosarum]TBE73837.1 hypothetical protein ELG97_37040 [Rhizobium leguminosarum]
MSELYNCCTEGREPDWKQFNAIEIGGCIDDNEEGDESTHIVGGIPANEAEFFTVYGHLIEGGAEAITDCDSYEQAERIAGIFAEKTGYPIHVFC